MKKKSFSISLAVALIAVISFLTVNCETGLGPAVDVQKPSIAITYPPANKAIREWFMLAGTCDDDQGVTEITVSILREKDVIAGPFNANIAEDGKSWSLKLNEGSANPNKTTPLSPDKVFPIKDGSYTIQVQAADKAGRQSDIVARSFDIDNTAPVLVLNKPMAIADDNPTSYGRIFKLAGDANDDHNIKVAFYFRECEKPASEVGEGAVVFKDAAPVMMIEKEYMNVSSMSSDAPLVLARYYDENKIDSDEKQELTKNYKKIYGNVSTTTKNITKYYYGGIRLMDSAQVYQNPAETKNESRGNETDSYIINTDELSKILNSIGTDGIKAGDIKEILNGTTEHGNDVINKVAAALSTEGNYVSCTSSSDVSVNSNVFKLNPDNNPTWSIANYSINENDPDYTEDGLGFRDYNIGAAHTLTITPNTDGDRVVPRNVTLYYVQCIRVGDKWQEQGKKHYLIKPKEPKDPKFDYGSAVVWDDDSDSEAVTKGSLIIDTTEKLGGGEYYRFHLEGTDIEDTDYEPAVDDGYGFKVAASELPPTVEVKDPEDIKVLGGEKYFKLEKIKDGLVITGTIDEVNKKLGYQGSSSADQIKPLQVELGLEDFAGNDIKLPDTKYPNVTTELWATDSGSIPWDESSPDTSWDMQSRKWVFRITIKNDNYASYAAEKYYKFTVNITVTNAIGEKCQTSKQLIYRGDNLKPTVKITNNDFFYDKTSRVTLPTQLTKPLVDEDSRQISGLDVTPIAPKFELIGKWNDLEGSGTGKLYYWYGTGAGPSATSDSGWYEASSDDATPENNKTEAQWRISNLSVAQGEGWKFKAWAEDNVGNESEIVEVTNVMFDFTKPTISINKFSDGTDLFNENGSTNIKAFEITGTVEDDQLKAAPILPITLTAKYKARGASGFTETANNHTFTQTQVTGNPNKYNWSIKFADGTDPEGEWQFTFVATDASERTTTKTTKTLSIDVTPPVLKGDVKIGGNVQTTPSWITVEKPELNVSYTEQGTGNTKLYYWVWKDGTESSNPSGLAYTNAKNSFSMDETDKALGTWTLKNELKEKPGEGKYKIYIRAIDDAKNESTGDTLYDMWIDTVAPTLEFNEWSSTSAADDYTKNPKNSNEINISNTVLNGDVVVKVKATDATSEVAKVEFYFNDTTTVSDTVTTGTSGIYSTTIRKGDLSADGTYKVYAKVTDNAGLTTGDTPKEVFKIVVDNTAPVVAIDRAITDKGGAVIKNTDSKLVSNLNNGKYQFSLSGTWSDIKGSGTELLYCADTEDNLADASNRTTIDAPTSNTIAKNWSQTFEIDVGDQSAHSYYVQGYDVVGNPSTVAKVEGIKFDFADPEITATKPDAITNLGTPLVITVTASDDRKLDETTPVTWTIKKNGTDGTSLVNISTVTWDATKNTATYTLTFTKPTAAPLDALDGNWTIDAIVKDDVGRTGNLAQIKFMIDTTAPVLNSSATTIGGKALTTGGTGASWINDTDTPTLKATFTEATSGIDKLYYQVLDTSSTVIASGNFSMSGSGSTWTLGTGEDLKFTDKTKAQGKNKIKIWAVDKAGNISDKTTEYDLWIDTNDPTVEFASWASTDADYTKNPATSAEISIKSSNDIVVNVKPEDGTAGSGIAGVTFRLDYKATAAGSTTTTLNGNITGTDNGDGTWSMTIAQTTFNGKDGTYTVYANATDAAGLSSGFPKKPNFTVVVDNTNPALAIKYVADNAVITDTSADSIVKIDKNNYRFTLKGTWSDINGSGTSELKYKALEDSVTTETKVAQAPTSSTTETEWSQTFTITRGDQKLHSYWVQGSDVVGNLSEVKEVKNIKFDFEDPTITATKPAAINNLSSDLVITLTAEDDRMLNSTLKADDVTVTNTTNAASAKPNITFAWDDDDNTSPNYHKKAIYTITFKKPTVAPLDALDGNWTIDAKVKDDVNREGSLTQIAFMIDTQKPTIGDVTLPDNGGYKLGDSNYWYRSTSLNVAGVCSDNLSGVAKVYYWVKDEAVTPKPENFATTEKPKVGSINSDGKGFTANGVGEFKNGRANYVYFMVEDVAGNRSEITPFKQVQIDNGQPTANLDNNKDDEGNTKDPSYNFRTLTNDESEDLVFKGEIIDPDNASGIKSFTIKLGTEVSITVEPTGTASAEKEDAHENKLELGEQTDVMDGSKVTAHKRTWMLTVKPGAFGTNASGTRALKYDVYDNAGNNNTNMDLEKITIDKKAPEPKITEVTTWKEGSTNYVNKTFTVRGTNTDNYTIRNLVLKYRIGSTGDFNIFTGSVTKDSDGNYVWQESGTGGIKIDGHNTSWTVKIDSTKAFGNTVEDNEVTIIAVSTDDAGNTSKDGDAALANAKASFTVDQDTDRPTITLTTGISNKGDKKFVKEGTLKGQVSDDDGAVTEVYVSLTEMTFDANGVRTAGGTLMTDLTDWSFDLGDDGSKDVYFYVKDAAGGVFSYHYASATDKHGNLRFKESKEVTTPTDLADKFTFVKDVTEPTIVSGKATYGATPTTEDLTKTLYLGGTERSTGKFAFRAQDTNGVESMSVVVTNTSDNNKVVGKYTTEATAPSGYTSIRGFTASTDATWNIDFADVNFYKDKEHHWESGIYEFEVTAVDSSGTLKTEKRQVKVDFTPPIVTSFSPNDAIIVQKKLFVQFSDSEGLVVGDSIKEGGIKWIIPTKAQNVDDTARDAISDSDWNTSLGNPLSKDLIWEDISKYSDTTGVTGYATKVASGENAGLLEVPVLFKLTDHIGNTGYVEKHIYIDLEKSRPTTAITYPSNKATVGNSTTIYLNSIMSGESDATPKVKEVRLQIDANGDDDYTIDDLLILCGHPDSTLRTALTDSQKADNRNKWQAWAIQESDVRPGEPRLVAKGASGNDLITIDNGKLKLADNIKTETVDWYVVANGTEDGKILITTSLFNDSYTENLSIVASGELKNPIVNIRAKSFGKVTTEADGLKEWNNAEHIRPWMDGTDPYDGVAYLNFKVDTGVPPQPTVYLVQYSSDPTAEQIEKGTADELITIKRPYKDKMHISPKVGNGKWYIKTTIEDETSLDNYSLSKNSSSTVNNEVFQDQSKEGISDTTPTDKWNIAAQITEPTTTDGHIYIELTFFDNSGKSQSKNIDIYTDATAPTIAEADGETAADGGKTVLLKDANNKMIGDKAATVAYVEESDGIFQMGGGDGSITDTTTVTGAASGLKYVVFWFERRAKSGTNHRLINPMLAKGSNETALTDLTPTTDGLMVKKYAEVGRPSETTLTLASVPANIRRGGLVKIGGVYVMIKDIADTTITLSEEVDTKFKSAEFVYAQVVNQTEGKDDNYTYDSTGEIDGDGIKERLNVSNGIWEAQFHSTNMEDGPVYVHVTAIDNAGNVSKASVLTTITNNRPRITKVMVASDWNRDNSYRISDDAKTIKNTLDADSATPDGKRFGEFVYYSTIQAKPDVEGNVVGKSIVTVGSATAPFVVPTTLCVIPEFTGGNGVLKYTSAVWDADAETRITGTGENVKSLLNGSTNLKIKNDGTANSPDAVAQLIQTATDTDKADSTIKAKYGGIIIDNATLKTYDETGAEPIKYFAFTFWDQAAETTQGTDSLWALLKVAVKLKVNEKNEPKPKIKPFHWNSKTDNSIHKDENGKLLGHIELEGDLTDSLKTAYDADDPKVSGAIIVDGFAEDDVQLSTIGISFADVTGLTSRVDVLEFNKNNEWVATSNVGAGKAVIAASAEDEFNEPSPTRNMTHRAKFAITVDTEKLSSIVGKDKGIRVYATDWNNNKFEGTETAQTKTVVDAGVIDETAYTDYYKVDVVPYVTSVTTSLSKINKKVPSVFDRTSSGHYPVYFQTKPSEKGEEITVNGFNLSGSGITVSVKDKNSNTFALTNKVGTVTKDMATGKWTVIVTSGGTAFEATNNLNNNDAYGTAYTTTPTAAQIGKTGNKTIYDNYYNRQPNGQNNNLLTDDLEFDVWEFNSKAAEPISGKIEQPHMKINPKTDEIGFAFVNGPLYFSMGGKTSNGQTSYDYWLASFDFFTSVGFAYDSFGHSYGVAAGGDINSGSSDRFTFMTSRWGIGERGQYGSYHSTNTKRLENIAQKNDKGVYEFDKQRIKSPSIATYTEGTDTTNVYLAYYDAMNAEIRFMSGSNKYKAPSNPNQKYDLFKKDVDQSKFDGDSNEVANTHEDSVPWQFGHIYNATSIIQNGDIINLYKSDGSVLASNVEVFGMTNGTWFSVKGVTFPEENGSTAGGTQLKVSHGVSQQCTQISIVKKADIQFFVDHAIDSAPPAYANDHVQIVADDGSRYQGNNSSGRKPGQYLSLAATSTGKVILVWYDQENRTLWHTYNDSPMTDRKGDTKATGWSKPVAVFANLDGAENAGEYCQIVVDKNDGIHIAAYDPVNCDLVYAYSSTPQVTKSSDFTTCVVDGNGVLGSNLTIDVGLNDAGKPIPQIGYYATSAVKPKYAYLADPDKLLTGGSINDEFTGVWECTIVPTPSNVNMQSNQYNKINVGVWKDSSTGKIKAATKKNSTTYNATNGYNSKSYGFCYSNGTANAVLGYSITVSASTDAIETAQMK